MKVLHDLSLVKRRRASSLLPWAVLPTCWSGKHERICPDQKKIVYVSNKRNGHSHPPPIGVNICQNTH